MVVLVNELEKEMVRLKQPYQHNGFTLFPVKYGPTNAIFIVQLDRVRIVAPAFTFLELALDPASKERLESIEQQMLERIKRSTYNRYLRCNIHTVQNPIKLHVPLIMVNEVSEYQVGDMIRVLLHYKAVIVDDKGFINITKSLVRLQSYEVKSAFKPCLPPPPPPTNSLLPLPSLPAPPPSPPPPPPPPPPPLLFLPIKITSSQKKGATKVNTDQKAPSLNEILEARSKLKCREPKTKDLAIV